MHIFISIITIPFKIVLYPICVPLIAGFVVQLSALGGKDISYWHELLMSTKGWFLM